MRTVKIELTIGDAGGRLVQGSIITPIFDRIEPADHAQNIKRLAEQLIDDGIERLIKGQRKGVAWVLPEPEQPLKTAEKILAQLAHGRYDSAIILWEQADALSAELKRLRETCGE